MKPENLESPIRFCLYARKSSEDDERQAMSIESQVKEMSQLVEKEGLLIKEIRRESHSAKQSGQRPIFSQLLKDIQSGVFTGILTWAPDRLSRNAGDLGMLVDMMDMGKLQQIRTFSQSFSNNPNEKFLLMILCSQAKLENDNRGINVKRGIRAKCEMGWRPGIAPLGYMNRAFGGKKDIIVDPDRAPLIQELFHRVAEYGQSGRTIKKWLDKAGFTNRSGKKTTLSQIYIILKNPFYYGKFYYGKELYVGSHKPLISEEIFQKVKKQLVIPRKVKWGSKSFAFKNLFKCASCGSSLTGEEKFRRRLDGSVRRHVYYHCSRQINYDCPERYISENDLAGQLITLVDQINFEEITVSEKFQGMLLDYQRVTGEILRQKGINSENSITDLKSFATYVLREGTHKEKSDFIRGLPIQFYLRDRVLTNNCDTFSKVEI